MGPGFPFFGASGAGTGTGTTAGTGKGTCTEPVSSSAVDALAKELVQSQCLVPAAVDALVKEPYRACA